ncbi:hypothetical protein CNO08_15540 [Lysobacter capsici]|nr:hypothetical protein CNO08_15540 [Lysobacter capsici]
MQTARPTAAAPSPPLTLVLLLTVAVLAALASVLIWQFGPARRQRAMREVLDAADALEARLRTARAEIEAVAGDEGRDPVGDAMREMLRQRLWLRDHGRRASPAQLIEVRASIDAARVKIEQLLNEIERVRTAPLG